MTTRRQDDEFRDCIFPAAQGLKSALEWIKNNLEPDDVFDDATLEEWAVDYVSVEAMPQAELEAWADANGYTNIIEPQRQERERIIALLENLGFERIGFGTVRETIESKL